MPKLQIRLCATAVALAALFAAHAQDGNAPSPTGESGETVGAATQARPCAGSEHRQFDFWLGEWEVTGGPKLDKIVGHNRITSVASGCALREH